MIDPLTSLGLACNIVQLVEFGCNVIQKGRELASNGTTDERKHLEKLATDTSRLYKELEEQLEPQKIKVKKSDDQQDQDATATRNNEDDSSMRMDHTLFPTLFNLDEPFPNTGTSLRRRIHKEKKKDADDEIRLLADETKDVADELKGLLARLDLRDLDSSSEEDEEPRPAKKRRLISRRNPRRFARSLWESACKDKSVTKLKNRMVDLQRNMVLRMLVVQSSSSSSVLRSLNSISDGLEKERADRVAAYEKMIPVMRSRVEAFTENADTTIAFDLRLEDLAKHSRITVKCQQVLRTLVFEEVHRREDTIADAHAKTFAWIFDESKTEFSQWASNRNGAFWITGKPGCGKSTLMKYIVQHPHTMQLLQQWAKDEEIVVAYHYFWNAGTSMQKSQEGLLRTLLVHIIKQCPELFVERLPAIMQKDVLKPMVPWTRRQLFDMIKAFGGARGSGERLCIFIDGLDEYEGEAADLVALISTIAESPHIKVCVSSRPWNVFTRAYHKRTDGQLEVHELTKYDIKRYVNDEMETDDHFRVLRERDEFSCLALVENITNKAQGVFLWVYLVVRSLLRGLKNDDDFKILHRRLDTYPDTLDGYFQRMFDRIENVYRKESSRLLLVAMAAGTLPFWTPYCLELEGEFPDYALAIRTPPTEEDAAMIYRHFEPTGGYISLSGATAIDGPPLLNDKKLDDAAIHTLYSHRYERTPCGRMELIPGLRGNLMRYLDARTADLLEVTPNGIAFIHRTARDFLAASDLSVGLYTHAGSDFDVSLSSARLSVVAAKMRTGRGEFTDTTGSFCRLHQFRRLIKPSNMSAYESLDLNLALGNSDIREKGEDLTVTALLDRSNTDPDKFFCECVECGDF